MITPAHLFLLLLPGGVQETLPLPFLLRYHVSVPVGLHVVHPIRSCVRVSRSFKTKPKSLMSHDSVTTLSTTVTTGEKIQQLDEVRKRERERKEKKKKKIPGERTPAGAANASLLSEERTRETLDRRSICVYSTALTAYVRNVRSVTATRVPKIEERGEVERDGSR